jgi:ribonuclease VapC
VVISAGTLAEAVIVADRRNVGPELAGVVEDMGFDRASMSAASSGPSPKPMRRGGRA